MGSISPSISNTDQFRLNLSRTELFVARSRASLAGVGLRTATKLMFFPTSDVDDESSYLLSIGQRHYGNSVGITDDEVSRADHDPPTSHWVSDLTSALLAGAGRTHTSGENWQAQRFQRCPIPNCAVDDNSDDASIEGCACHQFAEKSVCQRSLAIDNQHIAWFGNSNSPMNHQVVTATNQNREGSTQEAPAADATDLTAHHPESIHGVADHRSGDCGELPEDVQLGTWPTCGDPPSREAFHLTAVRAFGHFHERSTLSQELVIQCLAVADLAGPPR
jgi:hypothetical protein